MTPEQMVVSRELAAELYRAGVPQESYWSWSRDHSTHDWRLALSCDVRGIIESYAAYTVGELISLLGSHLRSIDTYPVVLGELVPSYIAYAHVDLPYDPKYGGTSQDAAARLLLAVWRTRDDAGAE